MGRTQFFFCATISGRGEQPAKRAALNLFCLLRAREFEWRRDDTEAKIWDSQALAPPEIDSMSARYCVPRRQRLDIRPDGIILSVVIFTKVFLLKLLLGFGFGLIILALL
jgi:hypothetical protein